jgi:PAS domain S-box-containing protein
MNRTATPPASADFLIGDGEMARLIRSKDWPKTSLGQIADWPQSLRTTVSLCLASNFPINIIWGPDNAQICNDGYRIVCGDAHPTALGQGYHVTWASAWPAIGEPFERARAGETSYLENQRMFLTRNGYLEETFFTFSLSPIRDESGGIGGLFHPVTETTATMLSERRTRALRDLMSGLGGATHVETLSRVIIETLSRFEFDLPFLLLYLLAPDGDGYALAGRHGVDAEASAAPGVIAITAIVPWPIADAVRSRQIIAMEDVGRLFGAVPVGPYEEPPNRAFVLPIGASGADPPAAILVAGASSRLPMTDVYRGFYELLTVSSSAALATVRAREDARQRREAAARERELLSELAAEKGRIALRETAQQLEVALDAARMGTWELDLKTNKLTTSDVCRKDYGWLSPQPMTYRDLLALVHPDDRQHRNKNIGEAFALGQDLEVEYRVIRPDGDIVWMLVRGRAEYNAEGAPIRATGVSLDITDRKHAEHRQNLLIAELNHRVKNTLASVQSLALQTRRTAKSSGEFDNAFDGRIRALVMAHDLLTANSWEGAKLKDVINQTLAPYAARSGGQHRIEIAGPPVRLSPDTAVTLHMAFHELATNAVKYGALSASNGTIAVRWRADDSSDPATIEIVWAEQGGPPVEAPTRRGFGSNLLEAGLARELDGEVALNFPPDGLICRMRFTASGKMSLLA